MTQASEIGPRQRMLSVRFGGELVWVGENEKDFDGNPHLEAVLEALETEADGVRRATAEILDEDGGGNLYFTLLIHAPTFCAEWDAEVAELRAQGEVIEPGSIVEGDLLSGTLEALTYIVDEHMPDDWEFSPFSNVAVSLPEKRKAKHA